MIMNDDDWRRVRWRAWRCGVDNGDDDAGGRLMIMVPVTVDDGANGDKWQYSYK